MSITDEILRIKNNIASAYSACVNKNAILPTVKNSENLAQTISTISNGGYSSKYNITVSNFLGDIDENGELQVPESGDLIATGIVSVDNYILEYKFGNSAWGETRPQGCKTIVFPDLKYIGRGAMEYFYTYSTDLESVSFPELLEVGECGLMYGFQNNLNLKSISFPKLKKLSGMYSSLYNICSDCTKLENVNLDSLEDLTSESLYLAFQNCTQLKELRFPSLTSSSFNDNTDVFDAMLLNVSNCTVHFPFKIKDTISNWSSVLNGFSGKNTVVIFDLHTATLNFISTSENVTYSVNNRLLGEASGYAEPGIATYTCYDTDSNTLLIGKTEELLEDVSYNINIDFTQKSSKVVLSTGVTGVDVTFKVAGITIKGVEESNGNFVINVIGEDCDIDYFIDGGDNYSDKNGTLQFTGTDITISEPLTTAIWSTFTRPNLTANGTLGGEKFAVASTGQVSSSYGAYLTVDGKTSTYWWASNSIENTITFYNPKRLKVSEIAITNWSTSTTYLPKTVVIQGSNDNETWEELYSGGYETDEVRTMTINSPKGYYYHRIVMVRYSIYLRIIDIAITGLYKE